MIIREALPRDHAAISGLFEELDVQHAAAEPDVFQIPAHPGRSPRFLESKLENPDAAVFVADLADTIIGVAIVRLSAAPDVPVLRPRRFAYLEDIVVSERHRRAGVGTALIRRVQTWARSRRVDRLELVVWDFNRDALEFYAALGFRTEYRWLSLPVDSR